MSWTDFLEVGANLATGGLFGVGNSIFQASDAAKKAGDQVGKIAAEVDHALSQLFMSVNAMAFEMSETARKIHEQFELPRPDGRAESDLSEEEAKRLAALRAVLPGLQNDFTTAMMAFNLQVPIILNDPGKTPDQKTREIQNLSGAMVLALNKVKYVSKLIDQILYQEPGPVPLMLENVEEIIERINTLEMTRVEAILDDADNDLKETRGLVQDIRRMLWTPVITPKAKLSEADQVEHTRLLQHAQTYRGLHAASLQAHQALSETIQAGEQPGALQAGEVVSSSLRSSGVIREQNWLAAQARFLQREADQAEAAAQTLLVETGLKPGIIPQTIDAAKASIDHFHECEQPRIDALLESLKGTAEQSTATLHEAELTVAQARSSLEASQKLFENKWVKIGLMVCAGAFGLILVFSAIALFRIAFKI
jgi:hypothetical protein